MTLESDRQRVLRRVLAGELDPFSQEAVNILYRRKPKPEPPTVKQLKK